MAKTASDLLTQVRDILQDVEEPYRYSTSQLIRHLNNGLYELKRLRPDVWLSSLNQDLIQFTEATAGDDIPINEIFFQPLVLFVAGYAELLDDEFTVEGRAALLLQSFTGQLTSPSRGVV